MKKMSVLLLCYTLTNSSMESIFSQSVNSSFLDSMSDTVSTHSTSCQSENYKNLNIDKSEWNNKELHKITGDSKNNQSEDLSSNSKNKTKSKKPDSGSNIIIPFVAILIISSMLIHYLKESNKNYENFNSI